MTLNLTKFLFKKDIFNNTCQLILQSPFRNKLLLNNGIRLVTIKVVKPCPEIKGDHDERNARLNRVQSPHLSIYKPQLTSMLSISHRITGIGLSFYATVFAWGSLFSPHDFSYYLEMVQDLNLSPISVSILKMPLAFPVCYHFACGIRHLVMDMGLFFKIKEFYLTGYVMLATAIAAAVFLSISI